MQIGPERPDERGRVPATAVASHGTGGTGGHGWGHRRLLAGRFWRLWVPEGLRCEDGVCSGYGVQDARLWCRTGTQPAPRPPLPMHGLGMGWFWVPLPGAGSAQPYCRAQGGCMGLCRPQIPPVRPPGCLWGISKLLGVSKPRHRAHRAPSPGCAACSTERESKEGMGCVGFAKDRPFPLPFEQRHGPAAVLLCSGEIQPNSASCKVWGSFGGFTDALTLVHP